MNKVARNVSSILLGIGMALLSGLIVLGGFSLALRESAPPLALAPTEAPAGAGSPTPLAAPTTSPQVEEPSLTPSETTAAMATATVPTIDQPSATPSAPASTDTATSIPPSPAVLQPTQPPIVCGRPPGWVQYTVQPGDTLFRISLAVGTTVSSLQSANCLGSSTTIFAGQILFVPRLPATRTPTVTGTASPSPTATSTNTPLPTPTNTPLTPSPTHAPTDTLPPPTPAPTDTPLPTATPTDTPLPPTATPTNTSPPEPSPTQESTPLLPIPTPTSGSGGAARGTS